MGLECLHNIFTTFSVVYWRRLGPPAIGACANVCLAIEIKKVMLTLLDCHWSTFISKAKPLVSNSRFWFSGLESRIFNLGQGLWYWQNSQERKRIVLIFCDYKTIDFQFFLHPDCFLSLHLCNWITDGIQNASWICFAILESTCAASRFTVQMII